MANKSLRHILKRIDVDLAKQIEEYARKNGLNFREASREYAKLAKKLENRKTKLYKEIKIWL